MKQYTLAVAIAAIALLTGPSSMAQDTKEKTKAEEKAEKKLKLDQYEELIIRKKSDKDEKVTIEIKGGEVTVNGKPLNEFESDNLSVRRGKSLRTVTASPFRGQTGTFNFDDDMFGKERAFLGVTTENVRDKGGAKVEAVTENSAAAKAGLKKGDIITKIDQEVVNDANDVTTIIRSHKPEDKVTIFVKRDGKDVALNATLGKTKPSRTYSFGAPGAPGAPGTHQFAIPEFDQFRNFNFDFDDLSQGFGYSHPGRGRLGIKAQDTEDGKGVKVLDVIDESAADKAGIKEDDILTEFDGKPVNSADKLAELAVETREKASVTVKLLRDGKSQTIEIKTPKKLRTANL